MAQLDRVLTFMSVASINDTDPPQILPSCNRPQPHKGIDDTASAAQRVLWNGGAKLMEGQAVMEGGIKRRDTRARSYM
jgi:hypothetical protein